MPRKQSHASVLLPTMGMPRAFHLPTQHINTNAPHMPSQSALGRSVPFASAVADEGSRDRLIGQSAATSGHPTKCHRSLPIGSRLTLKLADVGGKCIAHQPAAIVSSCVSLRA